MLGPQLMNGLERVRRYGLVGGSVSLVISLSLSPTHIPAACKALSYCSRAAMFASNRDRILTLCNFKEALSEVLFKIRVTLVVVSLHSHITLAKIEVITRDWGIAVTGLSTLLFGGIRETLGL